MNKRSFFKKLAGGLLGLVAARSAVLTLDAETIPAPALPGVTGPVKNIEPWSALNARVIVSYPDGTYETYHYGPQHNPVRKVDVLCTGPWRNEGGRSVPLYTGVTVEYANGDTTEAGFMDFEDAIAFAQPLLNESLRKF